MSTIEVIDAQAGPAQEFVVSPAKAEGFLAFTKDDLTGAWLALFPYFEPGHNHFAHPSPLHVSRDAAIAAVHRNYPGDKTPRRLKLIKVTLE